ncbi:MAG TPA: MFS transporter, partial [Actinomycetes bacterium]|nr:MFS transporter [Actinomycetes bacterium]
MRTGAVGFARRVRQVTHAGGAGESGLGRLIELHGVNTAGDAMVAVALANTLFFSVPTGEARG